MKRAIILLTVIILCVCMTACDTLSEKFNKPESDLSHNSDQNNNASFDFDMEPYVTIAPYQPPAVSDDELDIDLDFEFDVTIAPYNPPDIDLSIEDSMISIDEFDFDADQFLIDSQQNFSTDDMDALEDMDPEEITEIAEIKVNLLLDLQSAFEQAGLPVQVDEDTGEIALDASVLFDVDASTVSPEGKQLLCDFIYVYSYVVYNEKYEGFVSEILIEGHTDTDGDYDYNLELSQERANQVMNFILSEECGIPEVYRDLLTDSVSAVGYSYDYPIYDENGQVDMAASRRVCFRFLINVE